MMGNLVKEKFKVEKIFLKETISFIMKETRFWIILKSFK